MDSENEREARRRKIMGRVMVVGLLALAAIYFLATFIR